MGLENIQNELLMNNFFYHLKFAWRGLRRGGVFSLVNIAGLSVGLTVVLTICAMIYNDYSFDKSFQNRSRIYRMNSVDTEEYGREVYGVTVNPFAPAVKDEVSEVAYITRTYVSPSAVKVSDQLFKIEKFCWADEDFFQIFNTPFVHGSPETALIKPGSVVLSESESKRLFGDHNPIGETILIDGENEMVVQAVYKDFPTNSSFADYSVIGQFLSSHLPITPRHQSYYHWGNMGFETFCLLADGVDAVQAEKRMQQVLEKNVGTDGFFRVQLQSFESIHLHSTGIGTYIYAPSDINRLKMLSLLAGIILVVACINYMNLSTARAQKRSKDIGISKTFGARRSNIINRLYLETGMITLIAFVAAFVLSFILLPVFNKLLGQEISSVVLFHPVFLLGMFAIYLVTTFLAASYPAFYLSGFAPLTIIRQGYTKGGHHAVVRKGLSVIQFSVAVVLVAWVFVIGSQMKYVTDKDLGYDASGVMAVILSGVSSQNDFAALRNDFAAQSTVSSVAFSSAFPLWEGSSNIFFKNLQVRQEMDAGKHPPADQISYMGVSYATPEIIEMLRLKFVAGAMYSEKKPDDETNYAVINRKAAEFLEVTPEEIIGQKIYAGGIGGEAYVTGVIEDFNFLDLRNPIGSYCFCNRKANNNPFLLLRINEGDMSQQLTSYEAIFKKHFPNDLFEVLYPSVLQQRAYEADRQTNRMAISFSILAIIVACLGVFGLSAFMAEQRTKEIGIRKVLGGSVSSIVSLFTNSHLRLLLISLVIAIPIAWWIGNKYLEDFVYRISLSWWIFVVAALITSILTLLTVCIQAIRAATANPVDSLKTE